VSATKGYYSARRLDIKDVIHSAMVEESAA
jgi:hypothetical protein